MQAVLDGSMVRSGRWDRVLLAAIACSLALHVTLLSLLPGLFQAKKSKPEPRALTARIVPPKLPAEPARAVEEPAPQPPKAVRPLPQKPVHRAVVPVAPTLESTPVIAVPPLTSAPPAFSVPAPPPVAPVAPAAPRAATVAAAGPDPVSIGLFQQELLAAAKLYKRYPRVAVDNNWEGKVMFRMVIAANGTIASMSVRKSSGYAALDEEGQRMLRAAKDQLPIPPALRGWEFTLDVGADFYFLKE